MNDGTLGVEQGEVEQATARRIAVLELQDEPHAKIALALAARIDSPFETGSALAALTKQLTTLLDDLAGRGKRAGDAVDELKARRLEKARGA